MKTSLEASQRVVMHKKLSLGLANCAVIKAHDNLPDPINECPECGGKIKKKAFWSWFRSGYNADGYDLKKNESVVSIQSSLMYGAISNKCVSCHVIVRTKDLDRGIKRFDQKKAYMSIFGL